MKVAIIVAAGLLLSGCDRAPAKRDTAQSVTAPTSKSENITQKPNGTVEPVRALSQSPVENVATEEVVDQTTREAVGRQITSEGFSCSKTPRAWKLIFKKKIEMAVLKVSCSESAKYQITIFDGKAFIKPWTGILIGN